MKPWRPWDRHPPWAHCSFFVVWGIVGTVGPIALLDGIIDGRSRVLLAGIVLCGAWGLTLGIDWLVVRRLRNRDDSWMPWEPPCELTGV
jgi:hypothetical protein